MRLLSLHTIDPLPILYQPHQPIPLDHLRLLPAEHRSEAIERAWPAVSRPLNPTHIITMQSGRSSTSAICPLSLRIYLNRDPLHLCAARGSIMSIIPRPRTGTGYCIDMVASCKSVLVLCGTRVIRSPMQASHAISIRSPHRTFRRVLIRYHREGEAGS